MIDAFGLLVAGQISLALLQMFWHIVKKYGPRS